MHLKAFTRGVASLLALALVSSASAKSMVFEISRDGNTAYLGGTLHLLRASDYPLPTEFTEAYLRSKLIVLETDLSAAATHQAGRSLLEEFQLEEGVTAKSLLSADNWAALVAAGKPVGFPVALYSDKHPVFHGLTLLRLHSERLGIVAGVDAHFFDRAKQDGKQARQLETIQAQMDGLSSLMSVDPNESITSALHDVATLKIVLSDMIDDWQVGDTKGLTDELLVPMREESPEVYEALLVNRNAEWMPQIEAMLGTAETEFILVGSAHLLGEHGLLRQLNDSGYKVRYFKP